MTARETEDYIRVSYISIIPLSQGGGFLLIDSRFSGGGGIGSYENGVLMRAAVLCCASRTQKRQTHRTGFRIKADGIGPTWGFPCIWGPFWGGCGVRDT